MIITNLTATEYWFGPMHLPAGSGQTLYLDDTSDTSLYLLNDEVADAVNTLYLSSNITVSSAALPFPRATGTPALMHGDGSPEGMVYAPQGSLYLRRDTVQASTGLYSKQTGATQNTGWVSVISAAGDLVASAAATRDGCLLCDGTSYARASYPILFAAIGTSYGSVDGSHFNVPDLRGRLPLGAGTGTGAGATPWTLGSQPISGAGGEQTHLLASGESGMPTHSHANTVSLSNNTVSADGHQHTVGVAFDGSNVYVAGFDQTNCWGGGSAVVNANRAELTGSDAVGAPTRLSTTMNSSAPITVSASISNANAGPNDASSPHNILSPVSVVNWFIVHG